MIKVSICVISYNQEKYIHNTIMSILNQETNFEFEIIVVDDKSTDNTPNIIQKLKNENPSTINFSINQVNIGASRNFITAVKKCKGEYIAILEGDDIWDSTKKLQKCINFLNIHQGCSIVHHRVNVITSDDLIIGQLPKNEFRKTNLSIESLIINDSFMATCSLVFRNIFIETDINKYSSLIEIRNMFDWPLNILLASKGEIGYLDENLASYRVASGNSSWSRRRYSQILTDAIKINQKVNLEFNLKYNLLIEKKINKYYLNICVDNLIHLELLSFFKTYKIINLNNLYKILFIFNKTFSTLFYFYYGGLKMLIIRILHKLKLYFLE